MTTPAPSSTRSKSSKTTSPEGAIPPLFQSSTSSTPPSSTRLDQPAGEPLDLASESVSVPDAMPDRDPSPRVSGSSPEFSGADRKTLKLTVRKGLEAFGRALNQNATRSELEQDSGLYLLDDDDAEGMADPVTEILGRRGGLGLGGNPDIGDAIRGLIAFAAYVTRQLSLRRDIRRAQANGFAAAGEENAA